MKIVEQVQKRIGGSQRQLLPALGLSRATAARWAKRLRRGQSPIRASGRGKPPLTDATALTTAIGGLKHKVHRTAGAPALWRQWQAVISRRDFEARVRSHRQQLQRQRREQLGHVVWKQPCAVWAMDPAQHGAMCWNLVGDLASRLRFELLVALELPARRIVAQLLDLFERYGAPLFLKRDNGSNLCTPEVDAALDAWGVLALTSPVHYPRYNGAIEYAQRELKGSVDALIEQGLSLHTALEAAPMLLNAYPRRCLGGCSADVVFRQAQQDFQRAYPRRRRKEVKEWINTRVETILAACTHSSRRAYVAAWRQAVVAWMQQEHIIELVPPRKLLPLSS